MWLMKITPGGDNNTKKYFENLFINEGCRNVIGYTKEVGKIESYKSSWNKIKIGDLIVVIEGYNRVYGVIEITSDPWDEYRHHNSDSDWFVHRRKARLVKYFNPFYKATVGTSRDSIIKYSGDKARKICDEAWELVKEDYLKLFINKTMQSYIDILKYKKQIILQGPPGTGKTYTAEKIAEKLAPKILSKEAIIKNISIGQILINYTGYSTYTVKAYTEKGIQLETESGAVVEPKLSEIIEAFEKKTWLNGLIANGNDSYCAAIAKYIDENLENSQVKLIQFHPAYSYEDFVRGITVENNGSQIEYVTKNKILGKFAKDALQNFINSKKNIEELSKEKWLDQELELFSESVREIISRGIRYDLSPAVSISDIDPDAFRYGGVEWVVRSHQRMKFSDLKAEFLADVRSRQDIKNLSTVSGRAKQHASYDLLMLDKFRDFLKDRPEFTPAASEKEELKNYVLIIDEINRANLPAVLGELIYALEYRGNSVESMYELEGEGNKLVLPENLFIIGTMNTADRSVGHIDYAIRRRFAFENVLPNKDVVHPLAQNLFKKISELFVKNYDAIDWSEPKITPSEYIAADFSPEDVWIGHSYFISSKKEDSKAKKELELKLKFEIKPLLKEYVKDGILRADITLNGANNTFDYINKLSL
jgi:DNA polymerase III delta prime subunit